MAPGSRGIGAVFVHSSGEDSDQTGDAFGEPRVPRRSRSHYLSNAPGLADQLVASRKDSAREGGYQLVASQEDSVRKRGNVGENSGNFQHSLISSACFHARGRRSSRCRNSDDLGIVGKLALPTF
uniref:Uncharacterized protein n=1 Tax=Fagus sylvatica TaxID=28930 RepID=A0A2N9IJE8_FAGSY